MNEILQKRIEEAAENHEQCYNVGEEHGYLYTHKGDIKEAVIYGATLALRNQWISVEEALPPHKPIGQNQRFSLPVLLIQNNDVTTAYIDSYDFEQPSENVTHWMPIPSLEGGEL